ncbi:MAG: glycosyltransferase family A protein [Acidimicrobiia bacterium]|nr:glycosyltransferase family A protein [Acidimicrobiia bacterium]
MARELPRTIRTLTTPYQRDIGAADIELIVVDNGSSLPVDAALLSQLHRGPTVVEHVRPAPPSPARAANIGLELASGALVGLVVDGARMASPGLLATACLANGLADRAVVATLGWHLGPRRHMEADQHGYDQSVEDELLDGLGWEEDGYRLFEIATFAGSSGRGWFGPIGESSALFLTAARWAELGGLDEHFDLPGGGLVNHDLYRRACDGATLVVLLGEGTFHQIHGGAATSGRLSWEEMHAQYERLRGGPYRPPGGAPLYVGRVPGPVLPHLGESVRLAERRVARRRSPGEG